MTGRILLLILCFFSFSIFAQKAKPQKTVPKQSAAPAQSQDELLSHLAAAEKYQVSGDLVSAALENQAVIGIALERMGNIEIEEGKYDKSIKTLTESLKYDNGASNRTNLAIAYLRQNQLDKALLEAQTAVAIEPNHVGAHYILANIYYTQENYEAALPELEKAFATAPDFELGRALGLTYLNLKLLDRAKEHFAKMLAATAPKDVINLHVLLANFYQRTNYPLEAERELKEVLKLEPNKPKVNFYLGYLLLQHGGSGRLAEAGDYFEKELKFSPDDFYTHFFLGVVGSSLNQNEKAIEVLKKAVAINPNSSEAYLFLGQSQVETNDLQNAELSLRRAIALESSGGKNTQSRRTHFVFGRLLLKLGKKEEGQKELEIAAKLQQSSLDSSRNEINRILNQVAEKNESNLDDKKKNVISNVEIKLTPEKTAEFEKVRLFLTAALAQAYSNLGVIAVQNNQLSEAIDKFSEAYTWKPDFPNLSRNLGIISFRAGEFEKAIAPLSRQLQANPQDILVRKMLGSSYYLTKNFAKTVETLKPIEAKIDDAELAYFYGISLIQLKRNSEAVTFFNLMAKNSQSVPDALFYAAQGFMVAGDYQRAVTEFRRVITLVPTTSQANYLIGQCWIRLNRYAEAEKAFAHELEINPSDASSKYHLALTLIERKIETDRAVSLLEEAISLRYDYADALYQLGKIYLEKGDAAKAVEKLESAAAADSGKDYIHYQLSIAYRKLSRKEDADRELKIYQKLKDDERKTDMPMPMGAKEISIPQTN